MHGTSERHHRGSDVTRSWRRWFAHCFGNIDAAGCQKAIVKQITQGRGSCVIAVKDNQPTLHEAVRDVVRKQLEGELEDLQYRV